MSYFGYILIFVHAILFLWATGGFIEMILPKVPWKPFTNPEFPDWVLIMHWSTVLFAAVSFILGYLLQWSKTPHIMTLAYGLMALVCIIETFGFMTSKTKFLAMTTEFITYTIILLVLFKSKYFIAHFNPH
ncbi:MAG: hypothetical protein JJU02_04170 [Cryomorphaceae bacterium]|nr:hypothetical protein [Cryomorphaceae bacterium]